MLRYGLDFGTTNSSISIFDGRNIKLLTLDPLAPSPEVVRSTLYFFPKTIRYSDDVKPLQLSTLGFKEGQISYEGETKTLFGVGAVNQYLTDNRNRKPGVVRRIYSGKKIKYFLGKSIGGGDMYEDVDEYHDETDFGTGTLFHALKSALKSPNYTGCTLFGQKITLEELIGTFVTDLKQKADSLTKETVTAVTCGRPVVFSPDPGKDNIIENRLKIALESSGFTDIRFEFEPVAAAKSYLYKNPNKSQNVLVFDFGGGTLDTTIVRQSAKTEVLATGGVYIGGDLLNADIFEAKLFTYLGSNATWGDKGLAFPKGIYEGLRSWFGIINLNNPDNIHFLKETARFNHSDLPALDRLLYFITMNLGFEVYESIEKAKKQLSTVEETTIDFTDGPIDIHAPITKAEFEAIIDPRIMSIKHTVLKTLLDAHLEPGQIDKVITTGGSSLIPAVTGMLSQIFGKDKLTLFDTFTGIGSGLSIEDVDD